MNHQGEVHRSVVSPSCLSAIRAFYAHRATEGDYVHGALYFLEDPRILGQLSAMIDLDRWVPYHDVYFINRNSHQPIGWHSGVRSLAFIENPYANFTIWMPLVAVNEQVGGRLLVTDSMDLTVPYFQFMRSIAGSMGDESVSEHLQRIRSAFGPAAAAARVSTARAESLNPGDALKFNSMNVHRAEPWRSNEVRDTYVIRFIERGNRLFFGGAITEYVSDYILESIQHNVRSGRVKLAHSEEVPPTPDYQGWYQGATPHLQAQP